jgi:hypothetical protein
MRDRDPRGVVRRRREAAARVHIVGKPQNTSNSDGSVTSRQVADIHLPQSELDRLWSIEYLERLARTYWRFLTRASLGLIRVLYTPTSREIVLLTRPFKLLTFTAPEYETEPTRGRVTWRIDRGLLVAPRGRGKGYLRIEVERREDWSDGAGGLQIARVSSEVGNFFPLIRGWGWFETIGQFIYRITQLAVHVVVTDAFFRSLARLDLAPSVVGAMRQKAEEAREAGDIETAERAEATAAEEERRAANAG